MNMMQKFLDAMEDGGGYNFIAKNYSRMSKFELATILKEYMYAVHRMGKGLSDEINNDVADSLNAERIFGND